MYRTGSKLERAAWLSLICLSACVGSDNAGTGALVVPFDFGKAKDCASTGVSLVRAELNTGKTVEGSCRRGRLRFDNLEPGPYTVVVYGLDQQGRHVMDSLDRRPVPADVVGDNAIVVLDPILLVAAPAKLKLRWNFGFGSCQSDEIGGFAVTAWNIDQLTEQMTGKLNCLSPGDHADNYRVLPDPARLLVGDQVGAADVQPLDQSDLPVGERVSFTFPPPPAGGEVRLSITCDEGGCRGTGVPDPDQRIPAALPDMRMTAGDGG